MTQLAAAVDADDELWTLDALPSTRYVQVEDETVEVRSPLPSQTYTLTGQEQPPRIRVRRGVGGTTAASHNNGSALTAVYGLGGGGGGGAITVDNQDDPPAEVTTIIAPGMSLSGDEATLPVTIFLQALAPDDPVDGFVWIQPDLDNGDYRIFAYSEEYFDWLAVDLQRVDATGGEVVVGSTAAGGAVPRATTSWDDRALTVVENTDVERAEVSIGADNMSFTLSDEGVILFGFALLQTGLHVGSDANPLANPAIASGTADPSAGAGVAAPVGSIYLRTDGNVWRKTSAPNTGWVTP